MKDHLGNCVFIVGAGPGDPGLMTARSLELIATADVIFYDRLIPSGALNGARPDAELVYVGKRPGTVNVPQEEIIKRMIESGLRGQRVVRLKGGDPFIFGRGAEEAEAMRAAGLNFEVVPGVTAGIAATAYAGIPVTHRNDASAVAFVTGHEDPTKPDGAIDWQALAAFPGTLVFYMGIGKLAANSAALIAGGRSADEPAAVIEQGTTPAQRVVLGSLATIAEVADKQAIKAPALVVVGAVAARREELKWFEQRPLHGRRVVVTRARSQASSFSERLRSLGADVVELPTIEIEPLISSEEVSRATASLSEYDLVCLSSPNAVEVFFQALSAKGLDARALAGLKVAVIGPGTAETLRSFGVTADFIPDRSVAEGLIEALEEVELKGKKVLIARAQEAREVLPRALAERGAEVDVVALYKTVSAVSEDAVEALADAGWITFTSASTVQSLVSALPNGLPASARIISIGPATSEAAKAAGLEVAAEAVRHDLDGLLESLLVDVEAQG